MAAKLQGHKNPWGKPLVECSLAEIDFILEMEAIDNPKEFQFYRSGQSTVPPPAAHSMTAWANVLRGEALMRFMTGRWSPKATARSEAMRNTSMSGMKPGVTVRGKAVNSAGNQD